MNISIHRRTRGLIRDFEDFRSLQDFGSLLYKIIMIIYLIVSLLIVFCACGGISFLGAMFNQH
jgi:hypothetical protein